MAALSPAPSPAANPSKETLAEQNLIKSETNPKLRLLEIIPILENKFAFKRVKPRGSIDRKSVHIPHIDRLAIVEPRELSRSLNASYTNRFLR